MEDQFLINGAGGLPTADQLAAGAAVPAPIPGSESTAPRRAVGGGEVAFPFVGVYD